MGTTVICNITEALGLKAICVFKYIYVSIAQRGSMAIVAKDQASHSVK